MDLVVLIGLQAAGKTSFVRERFAETHVHVSKDRYSKHSRTKAARQRSELEAALEAARSVVVDNTNPTRATRSELIALARAHGARAVGYYFQSVLAECLGRNAQRAGAARVPDVALLSTCKLLELPTYDEGFDELFYVRLGEEAGFQVRPWKDEHEARDA